MLISIGEIFSKSFALVKEHMGMYTKYVLLSLVPSLVIAGLSLLFGIGSMFFLGNASANPNFGIIGIFVLLAIATALFGFWVQIAFIQAIAQTISGAGDTGVIARLKGSAHRFLPALGTSIAVGLYVIFPLFLAMIGWPILRFVFMQTGVDSSGVLSVIFGIIALYGIFHAVYHGLRLMFSYYEAVTGNTGVKQSMVMSKQLTQGRWGGIFGRIFGSSLLLVLTVLLAQLILTGIVQWITSMAFGEDGIITIVIAGVVNLAFNIIMTAVATNAVILLYLSAKQTLGQAPTPQMPDAQM